MKEFFNGDTRERKYNQTAVEWLHSEYMRIFGELNPSTGKLYEIAYALEQAKEMEAKQRQADTNHGYSQGYDDGTQGKEPMQPEIFTSEEQSYQDKMRDKITKAKSRLK